MLCCRCFSSVLAQVCILDDGLTLLCLDASLGCFRTASKAQSRSCSLLNSSFAAVLFLLNSLSEPVLPVPLCWSPGLIPRGLASVGLLLSLELFNQSRFCGCELLLLLSLLPVVSGETAETSLESRDSALALASSLTSGRGMTKGTACLREG